MTKRQSIKSVLFIYVITISFALICSCVTYAEDIGTGAELQTLIDNAPDGGAITLTQSYDVDTIITIPAGKTLTFTDDGSPHEIKFAAGARMNVSGTLNLSATSDENILMTGTSTSSNSSATVFNLISGGSLTLKSTTIRGGTINRGNSGAIRVGPGCTFDMTGGIIEDSTINLAAGMYDRGVVHVANTGTFNMSGGTIRNNIVNASYAATVYALNAATVNMSGGIICDNVVQSRRNSTSAGIMFFNQYSNPATFNMTGGEISGNGGSFNGGGINLTGKVNAVMSGGLIADNEACVYGGGIYLYSSSETSGAPDLLLEGGEIRNNRCGIQVTGSGAGIALSGASNAKLVTFNMTGGIIDGNAIQSSGGYGGGIAYLGYVAPSTISGGEITNNKAGSWLGCDGGISLRNANTNNMELTLVNAAIYENYAGVDGGGVWFCPSGDGTLHATEGVAVFDNTVGTSATSCGDDYGIKSGEAELSDRVLGGGLVDYYKDGHYSSTNPVGSDRYDPDNPGDPINVKSDGSASYALKSIIRDDGKELAKDIAMTKGVIISGNSAGSGGQGGGIGVNNTLLTRRSDDWEYEITKKWSEGIDMSHIKSIKIQLVVRKEDENGSVIGTYKLDSVELSETNGWKNKFSDLPDPETLKPYFFSVEEIVTYDDTVSELPDDYFDTTYGDMVIEGTVMSQEITNNYKRIDISGIKKWKDDDDKYKKRPDRITVRLIANGTEIAQKIVTESDDWEYNFTGLRKYNDDGSAIKYEITEDAVEYYESSYDGYDITNTITYRPPTTDEDDSETVEKQKTEKNISNRTAKRSVVQTGDEGLVHYVIIMMSAVASLAICENKRRRYL